MSPALQGKGIGVSLGGVEVLHGVDLDLPAGRWTSVVGPNGAGKSTLIKILAGAYRPDSGEIRVNGEVAQIHSPRDAKRYGIETIYQTLALADNLDAAGNIFLGRELVTPFGMLDDASMEAATRTVMGRLNPHFRRFKDPVRALSGGQRQSVAIGRAVMWNSKIVILDEPTAALGVAQTRQVLDLVRRLAEQGLSVVLVSHNLHDIFEVADRITVLRLGRNVAIFERSATTQQEVVHAITAGVPTKVPGVVATETEAEA